MDNYNYSNNNKEGNFGSYLTLDSDSRPIIREAIRYLMNGVKQKMLDDNVEPQILRFFTYRDNFGQYTFGWKGVFVLTELESWMFKDGRDA
jgi:hypothetical protein